MEPHQNPSQERHVQQPSQGQNQEARRRTVAAATVAGGGGGQHNLPHPPAQPCPRCNSNNTKFCYYNNYSLSQPRYFCKGCRRYWTHGGTLRNVPVGGGSRKRKRPKLASPPTAAARDPPARFHGQVSGSSNSNGNGNNNNGGVMNIGQSLACGSLLGTPIGTAGGGGASAAAFYGGFLPGLSGIPAVNFGSNLGLLHGLGLPSLDHHHGIPQPQQHHHHQQQQQQQETVSFQELLHQHHQQNLHPSLIPALQARDNWILSNTNTTTANNNNDNNNNDDNNNNNNNNDDQDQWPDFEVGSTGLEDP